jgi:hypothetical protein
MIEISHRPTQTDTDRVKNEESFVCVRPRESVAKSFLND